MENTHKEFKVETKKLAQTVAIVQNEILMADEYRSFLRKDTVQAFIDYDYRDSNQSYDKISLNATLYAMLLENYDGLLRAKEKPYFCRIDFKHQQSDSVEQLYIGKMGLMNSNGSSPIVVDWRAPIASVYYEGRLGEISYETPVGTSDGTLFLKRQYTINKGQLEQIMDVDITTTDDFLQAALGESKNNRLKDIVSTIQQEQNEIIRAPLEQPLIVQGVAGSGKTTIALHRIAYLIYTYESSFHPEDFLIVAPNLLFLDYISNVLPELGADKVRQTTFIDLAFTQIKTKYKMVDVNKNLLDILAQDVQDYTTLPLVQNCKWKGSPAFIRTLKRYMKSIITTSTAMDDFEVGGCLITTADDVKAMVDQGHKDAPLCKRIDMVKKTLAFRLRNRQEQIIEEIKEGYERQSDHIMDTMKPSEERRQKITELAAARLQSVEDFKKITKSAVKKYINRFPRQDATGLYTALLSNPETLLHYAGDNLSPKLAGVICQHSKTLFDKKQLELEDLAPLMYLSHCLDGTPPQMTARYVVIDEAQDFSIFQVWVLKHILNTSLFTILGDLSQGIHAYRGISDWSELRQGVFSEDKCQYRTLCQSYRTTIEIMDFANQIIALCKDNCLVKACPVVRHSAKPHVYRYERVHELTVDLARHVQKLEEHGHSTIALICKTDTECTLLKKMLGELGEHIRQLDSKDTVYHGGVLIVPSHLAKGLEFDAVVIVAMEQNYIVSDLDLKLLYVAMTRALHNLDIFCLEDRLELLNQIPKQYIQ